MNAQQQLMQAVRFHQAGKLAEAEKLYREILGRDPKQPDALHLLGLIAHQSGRNDAALPLIQQAIAQRRQAPEFHNSRGEVLQALGRLPEATDAYREALRLRPNYVEARNNLGNALRRAGQLPAAIQAFEAAIRQRPDYPEAQNNLGVALFDRGDADRAIAHYRKAIELRPQTAGFHANLGAALRRLLRLEEAEATLRTALRLEPNNSVALNHLAWVVGKRGRKDEALALYRAAMAADPRNAEPAANLAGLLALLGQKAEAVAMFEHAIRLRPDSHEAYNNLGNVLKDLGRPADAERAYLEALRLKPAYPIARYNLGVVARDDGRIPEAIEHFRTALAHKPDYMLAHSGIAFALHYDPRATPEALLEEHHAWNRQHAAALGGAPRFANVRDPAKRLRVGFVSADFRDHAVGRNIHPLFRHRDAAAFELFAYAQTIKADAMTARLRSCVDHWREIQDLDDAAAADLIRADGIDVLVDLSLHTGGHRLLVLARKPAPVQVTFAGYPGTTGLAAIDYRLTDRHLDPPGNDALYVEQSVRLTSFWCFDPIDDDPNLIQARRGAHEPFTWGCLNNPLKVNEAVLELWARVLAATPASRLLILAPAPSQRERFRAGLAAHGIAPDRIDFAPAQSRPNYLATYNRCDVILDTFPYNGHTTTCDALWMGVPVVTLAGRHAVARGGLSLLANLGLADLAAATPDDYVRIARTLAHDRPRLAELHATLRARMAASPLMDAPRFAREIEAAFRGMWQRWCAQPAG